MSRPRRTRRSPVRHLEKPGGRRGFLIASTVVLAVGIAVGVMFLRGPAGGFEVLEGRWQRPDGGYIFEIPGVDSSGKIDAGYLKPTPINVARADATRDGSTLQGLVQRGAPELP